MKTFLTGLFVAGVIGGLWWLTLLSGFLVLTRERSYFILGMGLLLDAWFFSAGTPILFVGFYTLSFLCATICIEYIRDRLFWATKK